LRANGGIDRKALGFVLSMELIGMGLGSMLLGGVADKIGRRRTLLGCLAVMALGMIMATQAKGVYDLSLWRVFTGLGIGGMLAAINAVAAEFSNSRRRGLNVSLMAIGYPIGAIVGGSIAALAAQARRLAQVFRFGAAATAAFIPLVSGWYRNPFLAVSAAAAGRARPHQSRFCRMGHAPVASLPPLSAEARKRSVTDILSPQLAAGHRAGHPGLFPAHHDVLLHFEVGAEDRGRHGLHALIRGRRAGMGQRGRRHGRRGAWPPVAALRPQTSHDARHGDVHDHGGGVRPRPSDSRAAVSGVRGDRVLHQCRSRRPLWNPGAGVPHSRAGHGHGIRHRIGRAGAMLAPIIAGYLFHAGYGLEFVAIAMGAGSLIAAVALWLLPYPSGAVKVIDAAPVAAH
jgi:hypothetical protein